MPPSAVTLSLSAAKVYSVPLMVIFTTSSALPEPPIPFGKFTLTVVEAPSLSPAFSLVQRIPSSLPTSVPFTVEPVSSTYSIDGVPLTVLSTGIVLLPSSEDCPAASTTVAVTLRGSSPAPPIVPTGTSAVILPAVISSAVKVCLTGSVLPFVVNTTVSPASTLAVGKVTSTLTLPSEPTSLRVKTPSFGFLSSTKTTDGA